jgi:hypothetical protein
MSCEPVDEINPRIDFLMMKKKTLIRPFAAKGKLYLSRKQQKKK